jgi:serine/threonine-protein kinase
MGAVYRARDPDLGRPLAVKVLREDLAGDAAARRFVEEARIAGQLQHPGVPPVHEVGRTADGRPFIAMKLVRGRTLADLLAGRKAPSDDLPRFVSIFEQVCQALAYAHSRGVVHRDVKPANVMVGDFGEVQVMDWGLAKVLTPGALGEEAAAAGEASTLYTARGGDDATQAGSVLGTPAYMPPEQARGEVGRVDERSDVFGLGAVLCEVLTGRPPYVGASAEQHRQARQADLEAARARLATCGADAELVGLARACLAPEPDGRPRDAGKVAAAVAAYRAGVQERLRRAELAQAAAEAQAAEGRKRRRVLLALAGVVLLAVAGAGAAAWWYAQDRAARAAAAAEVERAAAADLDEALSLTNEGKYAEARLALQRAEGRLAGGGPEALTARAGELRADLDALDAFDEARLEATAVKADGGYDFGQGTRRYAAAFAALGIPVAELNESEAAARVARRAIREQLVAALDDWASWAADAEEARRLTRIAEAAEPEPGGPRGVARRALRDRDPDELRRAAADAPDSRLMERLAGAMWRAGRPEEAMGLLETAWRSRPADFWVNHALAEFHSLSKPPRYDEAVRYYSVAAALRPRSPGVWVNLGNALGGLKRPDEAAAAYRKALDLRPDYPEAHYDLGNALRDLGRPSEAAAEYRKALGLRPDLAVAQTGLGNALRGLRRPAEAAAEYRKALDLQPDSPEAHTGLGNALHDLGRPEAAAAEYRKALGLNPDLPEAHYNLGNALRDLGRPAEAAAEYRKALDLRPGDAQVHCNLGWALRDLGRFDESLREFQRRHELGVRRPDWNYPSAEWVRDAERLAALDAALPAVLQGAAQPAGPAEAAGMARLCQQFKGRYAAAARLYADAFAAAPRLADDLTAGYRYDAACCAALAAAGRGEDGADRTEAERDRLRRQALAWLRDDLGAWSKRLDGDDAGAREEARRELTHRQEDADLAGFRDADAVDKLPEDDREACRRLWAGVGALLEKAGGK